jgi:hypothetical protein
MLSIGYLVVKGDGIEIKTMFFEISYFLMVVLGFFIVIRSMIWTSSRTLECDVK